ncbi:hypothetical protein IVA88_27310 [Bradyrhizobium sp. 149]|uniref:hypothetical protein n=1 Tax=Bradyrhizobium sp. 149 TaxID=2782624 RepID=UPI001FFA271F|nr:hypothetical protein [Bradyrhizobium sp. 149]MCK1655128.1 hypothetical protein [Bradyrhizobium sp. 149]
MAESDAQDIESAKKNGPLKAGHFHPTWQSPELVAGAASTDHAGTTNFIVGPPKQETRQRRPPVT